MDRTLSPNCDQFANVPEDDHETTALRTKTIQQIIR